MEYISMCTAMIISIVGIIIAIVGLVMGLKIFKAEKCLTILEKHKHLIIAQLTLYSDNDDEPMKGYEVLKFLKEYYHIDDDYEALKLYYDNTFK